MPEITIPYNYTPRDYQLEFLSVFDRNVNRQLGNIRKFVKVWHRRAGKEKTDVNVVSKQMNRVVAAYYYVFPTYNQGKKILWQGMDRDGFRFIDHFPKERLKSKPNDTEMKLEYTNGSLFQIIGSDNIDSIVGTNPRGVVFSEYALQDPRAWDYLRPILAENGGWAIFNYTPRGNNHGKKLLELARANPDTWWSQVLTVDDTKVIPADILRQEYDEIVRLHGNDALYQQEYYCSFDAPIMGSYYGEQLIRAEKEGRLLDKLPYEPRVPVDTWWDLGIGDSMSIWFTQAVGREIRFIDYYETSGEGLNHYIQVLQARGYVYGEHFAPHDIEVREIGTGVSRKETAAGLGLHFRTVPKLSIDDGIHSCRLIFNQCYFDKVKCERGLDALKSYHKEWDEKNKYYKDKPCHDWCSHAADSFRTFGVGFGMKKHLAAIGKNSQGAWTRDVEDFQTERRAY